MHGFNNCNFSNTKYLKDIIQVSIVHFEEVSSIDVLVGRRVVEHDEAVGDEGEDETGEDGRHQARNSLSWPAHSLVPPVLGWIISILVFLEFSQHLLEIQLGGDLGKVLQL